jgi:hypothetical protein
VNERAIQVAALLQLRCGLGLKQFDCVPITDDAFLLHQDFLHCMVKSVSYRLVEPDFQVDRLRWHGASIVSGMPDAGPFTLRPFS